jgi:hypothetical protein
MTVELIDTLVPDKVGLYINVSADPMGVYELWVDRGGSLYRSGWIKCSEQPTEEFLERWVAKHAVV